MNLTRNKIFFGLLIFGLATNLLILFDIQFLYLRAIFSLIFLAIIPGLLIMLMLRIRKISFWEYLVYIVGLSVAFIMFAGLAVNWTNVILHPSNLAKESSGNIDSLSKDYSIKETELPKAVKNIWIGGNNILYGFYEGGIVKSLDNGATWETIYKFTEGEGNRRVWVDSRGTIFAGRDETGLLYMSKGGDNNWTTPLKFSCQNRFMANGQSEGFGTLWNMDEDSQGNLYVGEYGGVMEANCAYIYKSTDGGLTWSVVYDSLAYDWPGRHIHMLKIDSKNDYIYATQGDGLERARLIQSTDRGKTWTTLQSRNLDAQYTTMIFFSDNRLFGTDAGSLPNKILNTSDDHNFSVSARFDEEISDFIWSSSKNPNNDVAYIGTVSENAGGDSALYKTNDKGSSWYKVKDLGLTVLGYQGIDSISNFGSDGYAYYHDNLNDKTYRFKDAHTSSKRASSSLGAVTKPLSLYRILISFDIILLIILFVALKRNQDLELKPKLPKINFLNNIFFIIPFLFPILSILGAIILNNGGSNIFTMIMLGGVAVYVFLVTLLKDKLNENVFPWAILAISVALLLMGWLRSWFVSGADINLEYYIFQLVKKNQYWNMALFNNAYNACLSVSILPTILSSLSNLNGQYIFKLIIPLIFSVAPVAVYLFLKRYAKSWIAFVATFFFMAQPVFMSWWWIPIRQEMGFLFFALALLVMFSRDISPIRKNILLLIFLFSMVVSHYSTTYVALAIFVITYLLFLIFRNTKESKLFSKVYEKLNLKGEDDFNNFKFILSRGAFIFRPKKEKYFLKGSMLFLFILFAFLWYAQLTKISGNFFNFTRETVQNMGKIFSEDIRSEGSSFGMQWDIFYKQKNKSLSLQDHINEIVDRHKKASYIKTYSQEKTDKYKTEIVPVLTLPSRTNPAVEAIIYFFEGLVQKLVKIFIIFSVFYLVVIHIKRYDIDAEYIIMALVGLLLIAAMMILPLASIEYDLMRQYQQLLVILALPAILGGLAIFRFLKKENTKMSIVAMVFILYFLFISGFIPQIIGGKSPPLQLNNSGDGFDELYIHETELQSSDWLFKNRANDELIYADARAISKLWFSNNVGESKINKNVFPSAIDKNAYVYSSYTNTLRGVAYVSIDGNLINYNFPAEFLNQNKNLIYSNGESKIFK